MNFDDLQAGYTNRQAEKEAQYKKAKKRIIGLAATIVGVIVLLIIVFNSFTRVDTGYAGVQYSMISGLKKEVLDEGGHLHAPWVNVTQYPVSTETVALRNPKKGEDREDDSLQVNTNGGKSVAADVRYAYKFENDRLPEIFKRFRKKDAETIAEDYIKPIILDTLQNQTTKHSVLEVYSQNREQISAKTREVLIKTLADDGIILEKFTITDVRLDKKTKEVLQAVSDAESQKEVLKRQQENLKEEAKNIAQKKSNEKLEAEKNAEIAKVNAEKDAEVKKISSKAEAAANREIAKSVTDTLVQYEISKKADKIAWPKVYGGSGSLLQMPQSFMEDNK